MFQFDQLEHLLVQANPHRYQNELERYLHLLLNVFQCHELRLEEPEREEERHSYSILILLHYYSRQFSLLIYL